SLDGSAEVHDAVRVDHAGRGSYAATVRGLQLLQEAGLSPNVLCVVNPGSDGLGVYQHLRSLNIQTLDFLLPDVSHDNKERIYGQYGATPVSDYLIPIFDVWFAEDDPDIKIRLFWGMIRAILGGLGKTDQFGNPRVGYLIVETDGSIEPLDVLRV